MRNILLFILGLGFIPLGPAAGEPGPILQKSFKSTDGLSLHYLEAGQGPLIVFIPGWSFPASVWREQISRFSVDHRAVAFDPRSHGSSDDSASGQHPNDMAGDLDGLLDRLGGRDAVLVGWSLGGSAALAYLRKYDHTRIKALVLVDSAAGSPNSPASVKRRAAFIERLRQDRVATIAHFVAGLFRKPIAQDKIDAHTSACLRMPLEHSINLLLGEQDADSWNPPDSRLKLPILYVSSPGYTEAGQWMKKRSPTARMVVFEHSGHGLFLEEPEKFELTLRQFLSSPQKKPLERKP